MNPTEPPYSTCQLPLGYDGVLKVRAAPRLVLTMKHKAQPPIQNLEDWEVQVGGECVNVAEPIPCRFEWIIRGEQLTEQRRPHPRETWIVPKGSAFLLQEKDTTGLRPLRICALEFNLVGRGQLGYRLEPSVFGNEPVEVLPDQPEAIAFELKANLKISALTRSFLEEASAHIGLMKIQVGSTLSVEPDFCELFRGMYATLEFYPEPPEGVLPDAQAMVRMEWVVGDLAALKRLRWKVGFASSPGEAEGTWNDDHLLAVGGVESTPRVGFLYQLTLSREPPAAPSKPDKTSKKPDKAAPPPPPPPQLRPDPQSAVSVERPRLTAFTVWLLQETLGVKGTFTGFHADVPLTLSFKPFMLSRNKGVPKEAPGEQPQAEPDQSREERNYSRVEPNYSKAESKAEPKAEPKEETRPRELDDHLKALFVERMLDAGDHSRALGSADLTFMTTCSEDDIQTRLAALEQLTVTTPTHEEFRHALFDLGSLPRDVLDAFERGQGQEVFVTMSPAAFGQDKSVPLWTLADYMEQTATGASKGFAPFDSGEFVSRVFASGVCTSNFVTPLGAPPGSPEKARLRSPMPTIPADRREEFEIFVGTVCGESLSESPSAWAGVAHTIMNRVGRKYEIWKDCLSAAEIIQRTGFEAYQKKIFHETIACMRAPAHSTLVYRDKVKALIDLVTPIFMRRAGDLHGAVYFYSPSAQRKLGRSAPAFVHQKGENGDKELLRVTDLVAQALTPGRKKADDFEFYAFKYPEKWPQMNPDELRQARKTRDGKKTG